MTLRIVVRGGGDLASGVIMRLYRAGWHVIVAELAQPLAVRRFVSFAQAIYSKEIKIEDVPARLALNLDDAKGLISQKIIPVMVDPDLSILNDFDPQVIVDGRMRKKPPEPGFGQGAAKLVIGLGPGFTAGKDCHLVVETNRGPYLGRVIWNGQAQADTGIPEKVGEFRVERVLRAPVQGFVEPFCDIGEKIKKDDLIARVAGIPVVAPFDGVLRGLVQSGVMVPGGEKIGDVDPRGDPRLCWFVSDKALSVGGGVLEAILASSVLRKEMWT